MCVRERERESERVSERVHVREREGESEQESERVKDMGRKRKSKSELLQQTQTVDCNLLSGWSDPSASVCGEFLGSSLCQGGRT